MAASPVVPRSAPTSRWPASPWRCSSGLHPRHRARAPDAARAEPRPSSGRVRQTPSLERDFLTTVLGRPRVSDARPYCDPQGCCPTWRTTFGTTAPTKDVIAAFEVQGYGRRSPARDAARGGPFPGACGGPPSCDYAGRWEWRRVEVARGADVGRPAWPTVFVRELGRLRSRLNDAVSVSRRRSRRRASGMTVSPEAPDFSARSASVMRSCSAQ